MSDFKRFLGLVGVLLLSLSLVGIPSVVLADRDDYEDDDRGRGPKTIICHIPSSGKMKPSTLKLPAHVAQVHLQNHPNDFTGECGGTKFAIVAVSGTLEEGFPLRPNLDFTTEVNEGNPPVLAIFLGKALVRGVKAFLDVKDSNSREFKPMGMLNPINPGLVATGNRKDANISSIYLIDRRQALRALLNEPRYLSMVPDLAKVDIHAPETDPNLRQLLMQIIRESGLPNMNEVTFLQVISTWKSCHFVPSPILYTNSDGTRVTDFPNSLAKWAGTTDAMRTGDPAGYNNAIEMKIRQTLAANSAVPPPIGSDNCIDEAPTYTPVPEKDLIRYGVDKMTKRINDAYRPCEFEELATRAGLNIPVPECPN